MFEASLGRRDAYGGIVHEWSLGNYVRALEPLYLVILARSFGLALVTTVLCLLVAWPMAYWLALRVSERWRSALLVLVILPFWTSFLVRMYAWVFVLRNEGLVNLLLGRFGIGPLPLLYNDFAVLLGQVYGELPFMILPLYASLEKLDRSLLEAAADLGARPGRALLRVTLPLSAPGIVAGCVLVFIPSLGRLPRPRPAGRRAHRLHRQPDPEPVRGGPRHALRRRALLPALAEPSSCCCSCSAARCARVAGGLDGRRTPAQARRSFGLARLPVPLRAHPGAGRLLLQQGTADRGLGGLHPRLVREAPAQRAGADGAPQQPDRGRGRHRRSPPSSAPPPPWPSTATASAARRRSTPWSPCPIVVPEIVLASSLLLLFAVGGPRASAS